LEGRKVIIIQDSVYLWSEAFYVTLGDFMSFDIEINTYLFGDIYGYTFLDLSAYIDIA